MNAATANREPGRALAERLNLSIVGAEGHDLKVSCPFCGSSDAARVHSETGIFFCFACQKGLNAFDLCKVMLGDHESAKRVMHEAGLFPELFEGGKGNAGGNGQSKPAGDGKPMTDDEILAAVAVGKGVSPAGLRAYGARVKDGSVYLPMFDENHKCCSSMRLTPGGGKGLYAKGKLTGLFLPVAIVDGKTRVVYPKPGETWLICEGVKDAAALWELGYKAAGLPGNRMNPKFAPLFTGVDAVVVPDADAAGAAGATATAEVLFPLSKSVRVVLWPVEFLGCDVRDILKRLGREAGAEVIRKAIVEARPVDADGEAEAGPPRFVEVVTCRELLDLDLRPRFLVRKILVAGQLAVVGARAKGMKTSIAEDLIVSLGSGSPFLGEFHAERVNVGFWSGESGAATLREKAIAIAQSKGVDLAGCSIVWGFTLPKLGNKGHLDALATLIEQHKLQVVVVDPLYLSLLDATDSTRASDLYAMGAKLQPLADLATDSGVTFILLHHFRKSGQIDDVEPCQLEELSQAGVSEFARQWILLQRRSPYQSDGRHELWMRAGGSAGHAGFWAVDIDEGLIDPDTMAGRRWDVMVKPAPDVRAEVKQERESRRAEERERREAENVQAVLHALGAAPDGLAYRTLRTQARLSTTALDRAILTLIGDKRIVEAAERGRGGTRRVYRPPGGSSEHQTTLLPGAL